MNKPLDQHVGCEPYGCEVRNRLSIVILVAGAIILIAVAMCKNCH